MSFSIELKLPLSEQYRVMLPDFPALKHEIQKIALAKLRHLVDSGDPVLAQIKRIHQVEGTQMRYEQLGGGSVSEGFEKVGSEFETSISEIPTLVGEKFEAKLVSIAQALTSVLAKAFFKKVGESCDKAGTSIDAAGKPCPQRCSWI